MRFIFEGLQGGFHQIGTGLSLLDETIGKDQVDGFMTLVDQFVQMSQGQNRQIQTELALAFFRSFHIVDKLLTVPDRMADGCLSTTIG